MLDDVFTQSFVQQTVPRLPADSPLRLYTGVAGSATQVVNDDGTTPYIRTAVSVGELAIDENVSVTAETFVATLITTTPPSPNVQWFYSRDSGVTQSPIKIIKRDPGVLGHFWTLTFQLVNQ